MYRLIVLLLLSFCFKPLFAATTVQQLQLLIDKGSYSLAATTGANILIEEPGNARVKFLTAYAYQVDKQPKRAKKLYKLLIQEYPEHPESRNNLAIIYLNSGNSEKARQLLIDALNTNKSYSTAYNNLGLIYQSIASTTYRQAVSESNQPIKSPKIELTVLSKLRLVDQATAINKPIKSSVVNIANVQTLLIEQVKNWAKAWNDKDIPTYISFYSVDHHPGFERYKAWVEHRRKHIMRPGKINVKVSDIQIRAKGENAAIIEFEQVYNSPNYSDKVLKRLRFSRIGLKWKISDEQVISIL
jgi:tetratricopeptide (TPR) repeat protein